jgi:uncharacterized protein (DUF697 family)
MAGWREFSNIWKTVGEVDLRPIREDALRELQIVLIGTQGSEVETLAEQMRHDPSRPAVQTLTPVILLDPQDSSVVPESILAVIVVAAEDDLSLMQSVARRWTQAGKRVMILYNLGPEETSPEGFDPPSGWQAHQLVVGRVDDPEFLLKKFAPAMIELMPDHLLPMARRYPLFRVPVANHLINDTSFSNAAYALSTSLAELVPVLNIPFTIADMVVITKAQAFLVYRLGLAFGFSTRWQDYTAEFGSVIGTGFFLRQVARYLVGLIPVIGIIPKVAVAYSGTYVIGHTVLAWYLTGRHLTPAQVRNLYRSAYWRGRATALGWVSKRPRLRLPGRRKAQKPALPAEPKRRGLLPARPRRTCPNCGKPYSKGARYCQNCGQLLIPQAEGDG